MSELGNQFKLNSILLKLSNDIIHLQKTVTGLSLKVDKDNKASDPQQIKCDKVTTDSSKDKQVHDKLFLSNWKVPISIFFSIGRVDPICFQRKLKKIFHEAGVPEENKTGLAFNCLRGSAADGVAVKKTSFKSFSDFEGVFEGSFLELEKQRDLF